jgi:hypothetical protein
MLSRNLFRWSSFLLLNLCLALPGSAQTIGVSGVADKATYNDKATFFITNSPGFTYGATLDGASVPIGVTVPVTKIDFHQLSIWRTNTSNLTASNRLIRFIVVNANRACCDAGIPAWVPYPSINSTAAEFAGAHLKVMTPQDYPLGMQIPVIAWVENAQGHAVRANGFLIDSNLPPVQIRRGVGSDLLPAAASAGTVAYTPQLLALATNKPIHVEANTSWTVVSGTLAGNTTWPENSRISVASDLTIPAGGTLTIGAGSVIRLAFRVNINLGGSILANGTLDRPVVWTPLSTSQPWGGIMLSNASQITATATIWTGGGGNPCFYDSSCCRGSSCAPAGAPTSHRPEQSLLHFAGAGSVNLTDCAAVSLAGQFAHYMNGGNINFNHMLVQRCTAGGQFSNGSIVMNDSAVIEIPSDDNAFTDEDNDGLYLENGGYSFTNCLIGWTKDDGIDSGGSNGGINNFVNCWVESTFHEGISGSGNGKFNNIKSCVFINCGQAYEAGYSSVTQASDGSLSTGNVIGARFGDNYTSGYTYTGLLSVSNSFLLYNYRNVWGVTLNIGGSGVDTNQWVPRTNQMVIRNNYLTAPETNHPNNTIWNPATDGPLLAAFLNVPVNSPVGVGIALRSPQLSGSELSDGVPVRLSRFATTPVSVDYSVETPAAVLGSGTLQFSPGETVKKIDLSSINPQAQEIVRVSIKSPSGGELTSLSRAYYVKVPAASNTLVASGSTWKYLDTGVDQATAWRALAFSDSTWSSGAAQLGFGDGDEVTTVNGGPAGARFITTYFRQSFPVSSPSAFTNLAMWMLRDDGGVVYLNGNEVYRSPSMPQPPTPIVYGTYATNQSVATAPADNSIDTATLSGTNLVAGNNLVAVEIHQHDAASSDISFDFSLTGVLGTGQLRLGFARFVDELVVYSNDPAAVLEEASQIGGPWTPLAAGSSALGVTLGAEQKFYRLRK